MADKNTTAWGLKFKQEYADLLEKNPDAKKIDIFGMAASRADANELWGAVDRAKAKRQRS